MFDILNQAMLFLLDGLKALTTSYGWAIIALTVLLRVVLWPLNSAQARSMKMMQTLQPKLKQIQERYKGEPQRLQQEMFKLYGEHKFNPMAGCLPMLLQFPILIAIYGALISPEFMVKAGSEGWLFIDHLYQPQWSYAGKPNDGAFNLRENDHFTTSKEVTIVTKKGATLQRMVEDPNKALRLEPEPYVPGEPISLSIQLPYLRISPGFLERIEYVQVPVVNTGSRELETLKFYPDLRQPNHPHLVAANIATHQGQIRINWDVLAMVLAFMVMTLASQKLMQPTVGMDAQQSAMMKWMPVLIIVPFLFFPIPAGVMLYWLVSTALTSLQTWWVSHREDTGAKTVAEGVRRVFQRDRKPLAKSSQVIDVHPDKIVL